MPYVDGKWQDSFQYVGGSERNTPPPVKLGKGLVLPTCKPTAWPVVDVLKPATITADFRGQRVYAVPGTRFVNCHFNGIPRGHGLRFIGCTFHGLHGTAVTAPSTVAAS